MACPDNCDGCCEVIEIEVIEIRISGLFKDFARAVMNETFLESWAMSPNQAKALQVAEISDRHINNLDAEFCAEPDPFRAIELY